MQFAERNMAASFDFAQRLLRAKTPQAIGDRLDTESNKALDKPDVAKRFAVLGADQFRMTSPEFAALVKSEIKSNAALVKAAGIKGGN